ncbi:MAG: aminoacyl-tRNA hydrolase [Clostridia bacterium]|nr:aminoacyl-tRNA hydrolase [Oscillospiraceae bacterium]MBQ7032931.1 aminoacyl-tRNA hydrolase [Clostridia bacterium]
MFLIVGLGNPGRKYEDTRHNVGFKAIDYLSDRWNIPVKKIRFRALIGEGMVGTEKVILVKPSTFMNASGESVGEIVRYYNLAPENVIVIQDDVALPVGRLRIRPKGSDGGHNGIKSILYHLESDTFIRLKIGVGGAEHDMVSHVLGTFSKADGIAVTNCIKASDEIIETIMRHGAGEAMNRFNGFGKTEAE